LLAPAPTITATNTAATTTTTTTTITMMMTTQKNNDLRHQPSYPHFLFVFNLLYPVIPSIFLASLVISCIHLSFGFPTTWLPNIFTLKIFVGVIESLSTLPVFHWL
jgi:hypothetical protein